jgi:hypothetical protein
LSFFAGVNHLLNFILPAVAVAMMLAGLIKLIWRQALRQRLWWHLAGLGAIAGVFVLVLGLLITERDGRMATYLLMCLAIALTQWWWAFVKR